MPQNPDPDNADQRVIQDLSEMSEAGKPAGRQVPKVLRWERYKVGSIG